MMSLVAYRILYRVADHRACWQVMDAIRGILGQQVAVSAPLMTVGLDSLGSGELLKELQR